MRTSKLFTKTTKTASADEVAKNAQLLIRAGYVYKVMAGVYAYTPLGLRTLENIKRIVREEMDAVDSQEIIMTSLQRQETWDATTRWDDEIVDIWFKTKLKDDTELGLAWSHEEAILEMMRQFVHSYKDLPTSVFQFQTKLRNELRAKSGIMRGREFVMKDMYSLHASNEDLKAYYDKVTDSYIRIFKRLGIGDDTFVTFASGGAFTKFSHEFQTICDAGEDILYLDKEKNIAVNEEVLDDAVQEMGLNKDTLVRVKSAEVGNIFNFGTDKSEQMGITFTGSDGKEHPVYLGSYGIGITRVMGVLVEKLSDDKGIVWPEAVAPYRVQLVRLGNDDAVVQAADALYEKLHKLHIDTLYDDRDASAGEKLADADLIGLPHRVVVSARTVADNVVEYKRRDSAEAQRLSEEKFLHILED